MPLGGTVALDLLDFLQGLDQHAVGLHQRLDIHYAALGLLGDLDAAGLQLLGVLLEQFVGHLGDLMLGLHGLLGVIHAEGKHHLALPEGDGVDDAGLDLLHEQRVIVLDQADLGSHLDGDHAGQLQVIQLLLEAVDHVGVIAGRLRVLRQAGLLRFLLQGGQGNGAAFVQFLLSGQDVHRQLLEIALVGLVHLVQHGSVLHQDDLVLLQHLGDLVHVHFGFGIVRLQRLDLELGLLLQAEQPFLLLFVDIEALQLHDQIGQHVADLAEVLRAHRAQGGVGEVGDVLLAGGAVDEHGVGVGDVDLLGERFHLLELFRRQAAHLGFDALSDGGVVLLGGGGGCGRRRCGSFRCRERILKGGESRGSQGQFGDEFGVFRHGKDPFLCSRM